MAVIPILLSDNQQQIEYKIRLAGQVSGLEAHYERLAIRRRYVAGDHDLLLNDDQSAFLRNIISEDDDYPVDNKIKVAVNKLRRRINVQGFAMPGEQASESKTAAAVMSNPTTPAEWVWSWWLTNKMDSAERELYQAAFVDGAAYISVEHNGKHPVFHVQKEWGGTGESGIRFIWEQDSVNRNPLYAIKYWYTRDPLNLEVNNLLRVTLYTKNRIYKWIQLTDRTKQAAYFGDLLGELETGESNLYQVRDSVTETYPIYWTENGLESGEPLGLAVVPFVAPMGNIVDGIIGLQNVLNKTWVDIIALADQQGFGQIVVSYPGNLPSVNQSTTGNANSSTTTGDDGLGMRPGRVLELGGGASANKLPADDLTGLHNTARLAVTAIAANSEMPLHYFIPLSGEVPSGAALDELSKPVAEQAEEVTVSFTDSWSEVMSLAQKVHKVFGTGYTLEPVTLMPKWKPQPVSPDSMANSFQPEKTLADTIKVYVDMGVSVEGAAAFLGVSPDRLKLLQDTGLLPPPEQ